MFKLLAGQANKNLAKTEESRKTSQGGQMKDKGCTLFSHALRSFPESMMSYALLYIL
jgi:hypothetical protein